MRMMFHCTVLILWVLVFRSLANNDLDLAIKAGFPASFMLGVECMLLAYFCCKQRSDKTDYGSDDG